MEKRIWNGSRMVKIQWDAIRERKPIFVSKLYVDYGNILTVRNAVHRTKKGAFDWAERILGMDRNKAKPTSENVNVSPNHFHKPIS